MIQSCMLKVVLNFQFTCCGVLNSSDWLTPLNTVESQGVPISCCDHVYGTITTFNCSIATAYKTGCSEVFGNWVESHATTIGLSGVFLVLMQVSFIIIYIIITPYINKYILQLDKGWQ